MPAAALSRVSPAGVRTRNEWRTCLSVLVARVGLTFTIITAGSGCDGCDSDRRPYTPFPVASGTPAPTAVPTVEPAPAAPASLPPVSHDAQEAPAGATEWNIAERQLQAPDGLVFRLALVGGLLGGSERNVLAWLVGTPEKPVIGELWLYPEAGPTRLIATAPGFLPTGPTCTHGTRLSQTGPSSVTLDIKATCTGALLPRAPERSVSVLAPLRDQPKIVGLSLAAPAPEENLEVDVASLDRDADGRDDVELTLRSSLTGSADARARFVWLDRAAGLSRDSAEPLASFAELAALSTLRASSQKSSLEVAGQVASARRLYSSACAESGVPRVFLDSGAGLDCGVLEAPFEALTRADLSAALNLGQVGQAFAALERHAWFPSGSKLEVERFLRQQHALLMDRVVRRRVIKLVQLKAPPRAPDGTPRFSPLSFHADGSLLLLTPDGLVRAAPDGRYEYEASDEVDPWPTLVVSPLGERLTGLAVPCERSEVAWLRTSADGTPLAPLPTGLVAPRPGSCVTASVFNIPQVRPVAWGPDGLSAFVGAALLGGPVAHPPMGSATSPNGRFSVVATQWGLLVLGNDKPALWTFDDPAIPGRLQDCVVSNNAQAAACVLQGHAQVVLPDPKSG
jgi:hypothetical protein